MSPAQEKVAVLVSAGDLGQLEAPMQSLEQQAIKTYADLGFRVILVGGTAKKGVNLSPTVLSRTLAELKDVRDLRLDFIGHGGLQLVPIGKAEGRPIQMSQERRTNGDDMLRSGDGQLYWFAANSSTADRKYFGRKAETFGFSPDPLKPISHNDVKDALEEFRENNPEGVTTVNLLNCFSGVLAQELRATPNTIVFGNSPANEPALELAEWATSAGLFGGKTEGFIRPGDGLAYYYDVIGADVKSEISLSEARHQANAKMARQLGQDPTVVYLVGRSPLFESAIGWCETGKPNRLDRRTFTEATPGDLATVKVLLESEMTQIKDGFNYARAMPSRIDTSKKLVDVYKKEYESCLHPSKEMRKREKDRLVSETADYKAWEQLRKSYDTDPAKPLRMLLDEYKAILDNPGNHDRIFQNILKGVENDLYNLRKDNLPEERWGAIKKFIEGMKDGSVSKEKVVHDIGRVVEKLKSECEAKGSFPCEIYWSYNQSLAEYLNISPPGTPYETVEKCKKGPGYFECRAEKGLYISGSRLDSYWSAREAPKLPDLNESCAGTEWVQVQRTRANVAADDACIRDFVEHAPKEEWDNLKRISRLGLRDAKVVPLEAVRFLGKKRGFDDADFRHFLSHLFTSFCEPGQGSANKCKGLFQNRRWWQNFFYSTPGYSGAWGTGFI